MLKSYDLPNGLRLQFEEGEQPEGAVEHRAHAAAPVKKAEPVKEPVEAKEAKPKNKAVKPANKAKKAATKK